MKQWIWIAYDLGIRGDYENLYRFLDNHGAKECGDGLACLQYEFAGDLLSALKEELAASVQLDRRSRIYVIYPGQRGSSRGRFIVGNRKAPAWSGFGVTASQEEDAGE